MPTLASLTPFDWFLITLVAASTLAAFLRGIIKVLFSLGGLIAGILIAGWNYLALATRLHRVILNPAIAQVVAFLGIAIAVMVLATLAARIVRKAVSTVGLGIVDRLLGALFGFLRGLLFGVALMMAMAAFLPNSTWPRNSQLAPWFLAGAHAASFAVPARLERKITDGAHDLLQQTPDIFKQHIAP